MSIKNFNITLELEIRLVTCPGVWLCKEGHVSLVVEALGSRHVTRKLFPRFPLKYHEVFYFKGNIYNVDNMLGLQRGLDDQRVCCQLVQWPQNCEDKGIILAKYEGSLGDLLYYESNVSNFGVDLLMEASTSFPGIISPKIEIITKIKVEEFSDCRFDRLDGFANAESRFKPVMYNKTHPKRQSAVCHSQNYHLRDDHRTSMGNVLGSPNKTCSKDSVYKHLGRIDDSKSLQMDNEYRCERHVLTNCQICMEYYQLFKDVPATFQLKCKCASSELTYEIPKELSVSKKCEELSDKYVREKLKRVFNDDLYDSNKYSLRKSNDRFDHIDTSCLRKRYESLKIDCLCKNRDCY